MNLKNTFNSSLNWVLLVRPYNVLPPMLAMLIACIYAGGAPVHLCVAGVLLIVFLHSEATIRNDLKDKDVDTANKRQGILFANNEKHTNYTHWVMYASIILSLLLVVYLQNIAIGLLVILSLLLSWAYNTKPLQLSRRPLLSIGILGIMYGALPVVLGYLLSVKTISVAQMLVLALVWFLLRVSISLLKDFKDEAGDRKYHKQTFLIVYGPKAVALSSIVSALMAYVLLAIKLADTSQTSFQTYITLLVVCLMSLNMALRVELWRNKLRRTALARNIFQIQNYIDIGILAWLII
ncbi:MAG: UbiA family prenyltransferase [Candidatus Saccharimonadales bacterium]